MPCVQRAICMSNSSSNLGFTCRCWVHLGCEACRVRGLQINLDHLTRAFLFFASIGKTATAAEIELTSLCSTAHHLSHWATRAGAVCVAICLLFQNANFLIRDLPDVLQWHSKYVAFVYRSANQASLFLLVQYATGTRHNCSSKGGGVCWRVCVHA